LEAGKVSVVMTDGRSRNHPSQRDLIIEILKASKKPLLVDEIVSRMKKRGYKFASLEPKRTVYVLLAREKSSCCTIGCGRGA
jgi:Fe2+ or Zn2+ uptake regulation protein